MGIKPRAVQHKTPKTLSLQATRSHHLQLTLGSCASFHEQILELPDGNLPSRQGLRNPDPIERPGMAQRDGEPQTDTEPLEGCWDQTVTFPAVLQSRGWTQPRAVSKPCQAERLERLLRAALPGKQNKPREVPGVPNLRSALPSAFPRARQGEWGQQDSAVCLHTDSTSPSVSGMPTGQTGQGWHKHSCARSLLLRRPPVPKEPLIQHPSAPKFTQMILFIIN